LNALIINTIVMLNRPLQSKNCKPCLISLQ